MRYYIIAGEASGDLHGSNLIKELRKLDAAATIRCWGGDKMEAAGATLVKHYRDLAFMGFVEVLKNLRTIFKNIDFCKKDILAHRPDVLVLIDYPGFNLRIAKWAKQQGLTVIYYISPQVWAWKENRVKMMKQCIDKMLVILPFEKDYFKNKWNWEVEYVGHPLVEVVDEFLHEDKKNIEQGTRNIEQGSGNTIALLPGSRRQEILKKLPIMLEVAKHFPEYQFVVAKAPGLDENFYAELLKPYSNVSSVVNKTYALLVQSKAALVTSGTATLETAYLNIPQVVCYRIEAGRLGTWVKDRLVKIPFFSLVNLIANREIVKELFQQYCTPETVSKELNKILTDRTYRESMLTGYAEVLEELGGPGCAKRAANEMIELLKAK